MNFEQLKQIKAEYEGKIKSRVFKSPVAKKQILVCAGSGCFPCGGKGAFDTFEALIKQHNLTDTELLKTGCFGICALGPGVMIFPEGAFYEKVDSKRAAEIFEKHILGGQILYDYLYNKDQQGQIVDFYQMPFFKKQFRIALKNCGIINPESIKEYIGADGYFALYDCLTNKTPDQVVEIVKKSGLRGRGGGGFSTGTKWELTKNAIGEQKYVCCNGDEGDPGAFMDRAVLESDPHSVIEAMAIAGYAIGANKGYIYVRAEYPLAVAMLEHALNQARELKLLGNNIFNTNFCFDIELKLGAGAFVCGEETALMRSIEGKRGEPRPRPPYPANKGLFDCPTLLNNVETYANITRIILQGADWFSSVGTEKSKGTKVFSIGGKINTTGLLEVPMGITLKEIIYDISGGIPNNKKLKAVQTGGPSGGCIPAHLQDIQIDYDNLIKIGSMMGSGGMIVMDEDTCMVDIAKFFMHFLVDESCGKCTPCRIGTRRLFEMLERITEGKGTEKDLDNIKELCFQIKQNSLCGLGQSAPNSILSTLEHFKDEYLAHINGTCPAGVCPALRGGYQIDQEKCKGCGACFRACPVGAISGELGKKFKIDPAKCIKCGACFRACNFGAVKKL